MSFLWGIIIGLIINKVLEIILKIVNNYVRKDHFVSDMEKIDKI